MNSHKSNKVAGMAARINQFSAFAIRRSYYTQSNTYGAGVYGYELSLANLSIEDALNHHRIYSWYLKEEVKFFRYSEENESFEEVFREDD